MINLTRAGSQDLSSSAMSEEFDFNQSCELITVYIHASVNITETVTITFVSRDGSTYDTVIDVANMQAESDYVFSATGGLGLNEGDKVKVAVTNANTTGIVYVTVKTKR